MKLSTRSIVTFQTKILSWYAKNKRVLPWRDLPFDPVLKQRDPYKILVSEVMAQQTQLSRVILKYEAWIKRFPTIESLAHAPTREVLLYWSGLGYNRRALNLQKTAKALNELRIMKYELGVRGKDNFWPRTYEELIKFPGIGKYTANALLCFAFNGEVAVVDTNIRKAILIEVLKGPKEPKEPKGEIRATEIEDIARQLLPKGKAYEWNQALMDYAATVLKKEKILLPKQSQFKTSDRYYRGEIIKKLVRDHTASLADLTLYFDKHNPIEEVRFEKVIKALERDGLIKRKGKTIGIV